MSVPHAAQGACTLQVELGFVCLGHLLQYGSRCTRPCNSTDASLPSALQNPTRAVKISTVLLGMPRTRCCLQHGLECTNCCLANWLSLPAMVLMGSWLVQAARCRAAQSSA